LASQMLFLLFGFAVVILAVFTSRQKNNLASTMLVGFGALITLYAITIGKDPIFDSPEFTNFAALAVVVFGIIAVTFFMVNGVKDDLNKRIDKIEGELKVVRDDIAQLKTDIAVIKSHLPD
jgi:hypothetical protein